jgi:hypothetical protein
MAKTKTDLEDTLRPEYDFSKGTKNKFYKEMQKGYTVRIHKKDGSTEVKRVKPETSVVRLESDVREYFPDSEAVNKALRSLIELVPQKRKHKRV